MSYNCEHKDDGLKCHDLRLFGLWLHWHTGGEYKPYVRFRGGCINFFGKQYELKIKGYPV